MSDIQSDIIGTLRYLLDTCVIISALRSKQGASNSLLRLVFEGRIPIVMHYKLLAEYRAVLSRPDITAGHLTPRQLERFLAALVNVAEEVDVRYLWRPNLHDEGDNFIYEIAFAACPCTIVSHNIRDFAVPEIHWPGVVLKTPQQTLKEFRPYA